jgi:hypothetical protein
MKNEMDKLRLRDTSDAPWRLHEGGTSVVDKDGRLVASCGQLPYRTVFEERANAKLVSLAPDLADALRDLVNDVEAKNNGDYSGNVPVSIAVSILKQIHAYDDMYA